LLHWLGPQFRHAQIEVFPFIDQGRFAPDSFQHVDGFRHARTAVIAAQAMPDEFVLVVDCPFANADVDPALAEIVEQRELHGKPDRMMKRHLHTANPIRIRVVRIVSADANSSASL